MFVPASSVVSPAATAAAAVHWHPRRLRIARWGATDEEVRRALPGDELVSDPQLRSTRAVTIQAPSDLIFPWLAQLGQGRGGFYSYDWLENRLGLDIHSAGRIVPELQELRPGDPIAMAPGPTFYGFYVAELLPPKQLVLEMRIHPFTGRQLDPGATGPSVHATWTFVLEPLGERSTRLIVRSRARLRMPFGLGLPYRLALGSIEFVMERRMLLGIRDRSESLLRGPLARARRVEGASLLPQAPGPDQ